MREGPSIQIFEEDGEEYFRKLERVYLHRIIDSEDVVISSGGGTPCFFRQHGPDERVRSNDLHQIDIPRHFYARLLSPLMNTRPSVSG